MSGHTPGWKIFGKVCERIRFCVVSIRFISWRNTLSIARACSQLKAALTPLGFVQCKPNLFWGRTGEVLQVVRINKVRRVLDAIEVELELWSPFGTGVAPAEKKLPRPLIIETIGDTASTPSSWNLARFSPSDVAWRVGQVGAAFTLAADIAHHYSDRYHEEWVKENLKGPVDLTQLNLFNAPKIGYPNAIKAPSESSTSATLRKLEVDLFMGTWERCPDMDGHWIYKTEDGGFRYCAYLLPNRTGTLASIHFYSATSADLGKPTSISSLSTITRAIKYAVKTGMLAFQLPLLDIRPGALDTARLLLREAIEEFPANAIRPLASEEG
jgi:hypothetical protein